MTDQKNASPITFPCDFVIKVFGVASDLFESQVLEIIKKHYPNLHESAMSCRPSKDNIYIALSIKVHVQNQEALDDIYRDLTSSPFVLMAL